MENFNMSNFKIIKTGQRAIGSKKPLVSMKSKWNQFGLNGAAMNKMELTSKDHVIMLESGSDELDSAFYIAKLPEAAMELGITGAKIGKNNMFTLSGVYAKILQGDPKAPAVSVKELVEEGLMVELSTGVALKLTTFELSDDSTMLYILEDGSVTNEEPDSDDAITLTMYGMINSKVEDYTPKGPETTKSTEEVPEGDETTEAFDSEFED